MLSVFLKSLTPEGTANPWYRDFQFVGLTTSNVVFWRVWKEKLRCLERFALFLLMFLAFGFDFLFFGKMQVIFWIWCPDFDFSFLVSNVSAVALSPSVWD